MRPRHLGYARLLYGSTIACGRVKPTSQLGSQVNIYYGKSSAIRRGETKQGEFTLVVGLGTLETDRQFHNLNTTINFNFKQ